MQIYLAGGKTTSFPKKYGKSKILACPRLCSYFYNSDTEHIINRKKEGREIPLFLDSGAYSASTRKAEIDIEQYSQFVKDNADWIDHIANLDVIGDSKATLKNQKTLEKLGVAPTPVFHYLEDERYLVKYLKKGYKYIALGGLVSIPTKLCQDWLDRIWNLYLAKNGKPIVKVHGFGITTHSLLVRYPWYSVDSTTWILAAAMGEICFPLKRKSSYAFGLPPMRVGVTADSLNGNSITRSFSKLQTKQIMQYIEENGFILGKSKQSKVKSTHKLKKHERWLKKGELIEVIEVHGLSNDYMHRRYLNAIYFMKLQKHLTKNQPIFKTLKRLI